MGSHIWCVKKYDLISSDRKIKKGEEVKPSPFCTSFYANIEYTSNETKEVYSMSSIVTIISSSLILIVFSTVLVIIIAGAIASKVVEVMGKWELSRLIDYAIMVLWICCVIGAFVAFGNYIFTHLI